MYMYKNFQKHNEKMLRNSLLPSFPFRLQLCFFVLLQLLLLLQVAPSSPMEGAPPTSAKGKHAANDNPEEGQSELVKSGNSGSSSEKESGDETGNESDDDALRTMFQEQLSLADQTVAVRHDQLLADVAAIKVT
jgi:hypothetical protein